MLPSFHMSLTLFHSNSINHRGTVRLPGSPSKRCRMVGDFVKASLFESAARLCIVCFHLNICLFCVLSMPPPPSVPLFLSPPRGSCSGRKRKEAFPPEILFKGRCFCYCWRSQLLKVFSLSPPLPSCPCFLPVFCLLLFSSVLFACRAFPHNQVSHVVSSPTLSFSLLTRTCVCKVPFHCPFSYLSCAKYLYI